MLADSGIVEQLVGALVGDGKRHCLSFADLPHKGVVCAIGKHLLEDGEVVDATGSIFPLQLPKADEIGTLDFGLRPEGQTGAQSKEGTEEDFLHVILGVNDYG